jgi:hypothetical protein
MCPVSNFDRWVRFDRSRVAPATPGVPSKRTTSRQCDHASEDHGERPSASCHRHQAAPLTLRARSRSAVRRKPWRQPYHGAGRAGRRPDRRVIRDTAACQNRRVSADWNARLNHCHRKSRAQSSISIWEALAGGFACGLSVMPRLLGGSLSQPPGSAAEHARPCRRRSPCHGPQARDRCLHLAVANRRVAPVAAAAWPCGAVG